MDEQIRWVTKAEAARELEIPLSTLGRMMASPSYDQPSGVAVRCAAAQD